MVAKLARCVSDRFLSALWVWEATRPSDAALANCGAEASWVQRVHLACPSPLSFPQLPHTFRSFTGFLASGANVLPVSARLLFCVSRVAGDDPRIFVVEAISFTAH